MLYKKCVIDLIPTTHLKSNLIVKLFKLLQI